MVTTLSFIHSFDPDSISYIPFERVSSSSLPWQSWQQLTTEIPDGRSTDHDSWRFKTTYQRQRVSPSMALIFALDDSISMVREWSFIVRHDPGHHLILRYIKRAMSSSVTWYWLNLVSIFFPRLESCHRRLSCQSLGHPDINYTQSSFRSTASVGHLWSEVNLLCESLECLLHYIQWNQCDKRWWDPSSGLLPTGLPVTVASTSRQSRQILPTQQPPQKGSIIIIIVFSFRSATVSSSCLWIYIQKLMI